MKAVVIRNYGEPGVMQIEAVSQPPLQPGEVLVRMYATSVNPYDLYRRSGAVKDQAPIHFPGVIGIDVAGYVQALGEGVEGFRVGDNVMGMADRTYAELCVVAATSLIHIPDGLDVYQAASIPLVATTGKLLAQAAGEQRGSTVLVTGAAGNVGRCAVYALKQAGARVIAGVLGDQVRAAESIGADRVVATDAPGAIEALEPLDAVADTINGSVAERAIAKVRPGGVFASVLNAPKNATEYPSVLLHSVFAVPNAAVLAPLAKAVQTGALEIPVVKQYALAEAAQAHEDVAKGAVRGKALLIVHADGITAAQAVADVKGLLLGYNAALNESDTERVISLYTVDGIFMAPFSPSVIGSAAIREAYNSVFRTRKFDVVFNVVEIVVLSPEYAYARTNSAGRTTDPATGKQTSESNQELFLMRVESGSWKIARYSFSPTGAATT